MVVFEKYALVEKNKQRQRTNPLGRRYNDW